MKTLLLSLMLVLASTGLFAQHRGYGVHSYMPAPHRYGPPIVVTSYRGYYGYNYGLGFGWYPFSYWGFPIYPGYNVAPTVPCKKETLKDSKGQKHQVLVCRQADGSFQVVADADNKK